MNYFRCGGGRSTHTATKIDVAKTPLATFQSNVSGLYIPEILAYIQATQSGTGDQSPNNPRAINGVSSVDSTVCGKNLFNKNATGLISNKYVAQDGTETTNSYFSISDYIRIDGSEITVSGSTNSGNAPSICFYDGAKNFISGIKHSNYSFPHTYTVPTGAVYLRESISNPDIDTFQLELGSTATPYEPYTGQTATTALGGTYYGGYLNVPTGLLTVTWEIEDMGDYNWSYNNVVFQRSNANKATGERNLISDIYKIDTSSAANMANYSMKGSSLSGNVYIKNNDYNDASAFKTAMAGHYICYELATPQTVQLTPAQLAQLLGQNNVFCSSGDVAVKFWKID